MDADNRVIHYVEDDQGEGVKDPLTVDDLIEAGFYEQAKILKDDFDRQIFESFQTPILTKEDPKKHKTATEVRWAPPKTFNRHR